MFLTIKPKIILSTIIVIIMSFAITFGFFKAVKANSQPQFNYTIVIDAGHGGRDAGCSGINTGAKESDLCLTISKKLQKYLCDFGFNAILTRETQDGLYSNNATNFKKDDMLKREKIINEANANMLISIHLNAFEDEKECGAQAFYEESNEESFTLSNAIQNQLISNLPNARKSTNKGDYYILKNFEIPCSLVECGFLSNTAEENLLITDNYQQQVAYAIFCGVIEYINLNNDVIEN